VDVSANPAVFDEHLSEWRAWQAAPWGRLRYAIAAHVLDLHLRERGEGQRILDVGGGDGTEAVRLAAQGHRVTVVDYSERMLELARQTAQDAGVAGNLETVFGEIDDLDLGTSSFDVALCHFVVQYVAEPAAAVRAVVDCTRPGGLISIIAPNPASEVIAAAVRDLDFRGAHELLDADTYYAKTFAASVGRISADDAAGFLEAAGCSILGRYGGRIVMDLISDNSLKYDPTTYAAIEELELALCSRAPYRDLGRFWQLVATSSA
jgi:S-adenosylmethionine-dependent methyltransferase